MDGLSEDVPVYEETKDLDIRRVYCQSILVIVFRRKLKCLLLIRQQNTRNNEHILRTPTRNKTIGQTVLVNFGSKMYNRL